MERTLANDKSDIKREFESKVEREQGGNRDFCLSVLFLNSGPLLMIIAPLREA